MVDALLKKTEEYIEEATKAELEGRLQRARDYYLKASKQLFAAATESSGKLKKIRVSNAEKLLEKAKTLERSGKQKEKAGQDKREESFILTERPKVTFDDVAGLEEVKEEIRDKIINPFKYPEKARKYGIESGGGILLYGPPGTGKTYIAKAVANEVDAVFFSIKPSEIMSKWVGESEQNIAKMFSQARSSDRAIIFIDEVESLLPKRRTSGSTVMQRVVPQILAEMEGMSGSNKNLLFIGATNEPWSIDHAALRPGRFDEKIYVTPPSFESRKKIFELNLKDKPISEDIDFDTLANLTEGYSGADIRQICRKASIMPFRESITTGSERKISKADLEDSIRSIPPSIKEKDLRRFDEFKF